MKRHFFNHKVKRILHGADYNPDQWLKYPEIIDNDFRLLNLANMNSASIAIFGWAALEPEEGSFEFEWLDRIMDRLAENNMYAVLATPSAARPAWLSQKYPEVLSVKENRVRNLHGRRHNHCPSSPVYREKTRIIDEKLAQRYKDHPALILWHVSNELNGDSECHCEYCRDNFRSWLKKRYDNDLDKLNEAYWSAFWSHTFTDWSQIEPPAAHGEQEMHGLLVDWKRFFTDNMIDFMNNEISVLKDISPEVPVTTNFMGFYEPLNYWKFAEHVDVISWDNYPMWHWDKEDWEVAASGGAYHDLNRSLKPGKPFLLMESTPSNVNWHVTNKLKRPGVHKLESLMAIAHGSDSVMYFQLRKSRGSAEKFHGAVIDHVGNENTRVFNEVKELGEILGKLDDVVGTQIEANAAIIFDWENWWAINDMQGLSTRRKYLDTIVRHNMALSKQGIACDFVCEDSDFSKYDVLIAPMMYMVREGVGERIERFVENGGTFVSTYSSGMVNESDLCYLGGFPGPLRKTLGIWAEEIDSLYEEDRNAVILKQGSMPGLSGEYEAFDFCELIHAEGAEVLAEYKTDFYKGRPALTVNSFGKGKAYHIASRNEERFLTDFYKSLAKGTGLKKAVETEIPEGLHVTLRSSEDKEYLFVLNFKDEEVKFDLGSTSYKSLLSSNERSGVISLLAKEADVLEREKR